MFFLSNACFALLKALEEALNLHSPSSSQQPPGQGNFADAANNLKKQELLTQIAVLKEQVWHLSKHAYSYQIMLQRLSFKIDCVVFLLQVKIFEEDFRKERSDRERMNEEKEDLRRQVERLQGQITNLTNQVWHSQKKFIFLYFIITNCFLMCFLMFVLQLHQAQNECQRERTERCKLERLQMQHHKQVLAAVQVWGWSYCRHVKMVNKSRCREICT